MHIDFLNQADAKKKSYTGKNIEGERLGKRDVLVLMCHVWHKRYCKK